MANQPQKPKLPSPCISVCQMDPQDGVCLCCYRTRAEIAAWRSMDQADQLVLLDILRDRRLAQLVFAAGNRVGKTLRRLSS